MGSFQKRVMAGGNAMMVNLYRLSGGRIGGTVKGLPVVALTVPGRRTGRPRTTCVSIFPVGDGFLVVGSAGGLPKDPEWFRNLRAAGRAHVLRRREQFDVTARELAGAEWETAWRDVVLARAPFFQGYVDKSGRPMPIARLERVTR